MCLLILTILRWRLVLGSMTDAELPLYSETLSRFHYRTAVPCSGRPIGRNRKKTLMNMTMLGPRLCAIVGEWRDQAKVRV